MKNENFFNARPTQVQNLGEDVTGAARHHRDTYETEQERVIAENEKQVKKELVKLKKQYAQNVEAIADEHLVSVISEYEILRYKMQHGIPSHLNGDELIGYIKTEYYAKRIPWKVAKAYNTLNTKLSRIKYGMSTSKLRTYFEKKKIDSFTETNGKIKPWLDENILGINQELEFLKTRVRAVQFGNSVSDDERKYCAKNLADVIRIFDEKLPGMIQWNLLAFAFGARGKKGSVAHYERSTKTIQINKNNIGSLAHELGHAWDYAHDMEGSGMISWEYRNQYLQKLNKITLSSSYKSYLMKDTEIFARVFEQFVLKMLGEACTEFLQSTHDEQVMPDLTEEIFERLKRGVE